MAQVKCTKAGSAGEVSKRLTRGDFFGEVCVCQFAHSHRGPLGSAHQGSRISRGIHSRVRRVRGQLALLRSDRRAATVTATAKTTVLSLKRDQFTRLLGNLEPPTYDATA